MLRTDDGKSVGPFVTQPTKELGDITSDVWPTVFTEKAKDGSGPVYIDCSGISQEDYEYMLWAFTCEGDTSLVEAMDKQGIDLRKHMVEFGSYECSLQGRGVQIDENAATNIPGLYGVGDQVGNILCHVSGASTMGRIAGENAAAFVRGRPQAGSVAGHPVALEKQAREAIGSRVDVFRSEDFYLEFVAKGIDKAATLEVLLKHLGLTRDSLAAFGDSYNDIPMIKYAGFGVAMANSIPEVLQAADAVTKSNDEDGVAVWLQKHRSDFA